MIRTLLRRDRHDREVLALAVPALGAILAEPLFLLVDSAIVGHLGREALAGFSAASAVLNTLVNLCVFLAYGTTAAVARAIGAGDRAGALRSGLDGMWLALCLGVVLTAVALPMAPAAVTAIGATGDAVGDGVAYLRLSALGLPAMLLVLASTGVLRGLNAMRTTLVVAVGGAVLNAGLNLVLVYPAGLGIAGSAIGTVTTQIAMAVCLSAVAARRARAAGVPVAPRLRGIGRAGMASWGLLVRTVALRVYLLVGTWSAASFGAASLAAHGLASNIWTTMAYALDAIAIAGQSIIARQLGAGDVASAKACTRRMVVMGVQAGLVLGVTVLGLRHVAASWFTPDPQVRDLLAAVLPLMALYQPVGAVVFVLDGVLIGAGDGRHLAVLAVLNTAVFAVAIAVVSASAAGLFGVWCAVGVFMLTRMLGLAMRAAGSAWLVESSGSG